VTPALTDPDAFADRPLGEVLPEVEIEHEAVALPQHARERRQFGTSLGSGEALLVHAHEFAEGVRRSVTTSKRRVKRSGLPGVACVQGVDDVLVVSLHSSGDLVDGRGARELMHGNRALHAEPTLDDIVTSPAV
jgi:hypothetical protein